MKENDQILGYEVLQIKPEQKEDKTATQLWVASWIEILRIRL